MSVSGISEHTAETITRDATRRHADSLGIRKCSDFDSLLGVACALRRQRRTKGERGGWREGSWVKRGWYRRV
jgi:hypothetical protein